MRPLPPACSSTAHPCAAAQPCSAACAPLRTWLSDVATAAHSPRHGVCVFVCVFVCVRARARSSLSLPPRLLTERRLMLQGPPPLAPKAVAALLDFCAANGLSWPAAEGELSVDGVSDALASLATTPDGRCVLMQASSPAVVLPVSVSQRQPGVAAMPPPLKRVSCRVGSRSLVVMFVAGGGACQVAQAQQERTRGCQEGGKQRQHVCSGRCVPRQRSSGGLELRIRSLLTYNISGIGSVVRRE